MGFRSRWLVANKSESKGRQQPSVLSTQIGWKVEYTAHVCAFLLPVRFPFFSPFPPALIRVSAIADALFLSSSRSSAHR